VPLVILGFSPGERKRYLEVDLEIRSEVEMAALKIISITESKSGKERRTFPRIQALMNVKVYGVEGYISPHLCVVKNISFGGVCLRVEGKGVIFKVGEEVNIHFAFPSEKLPLEKLLLPSKVVWVLERLDGIEYGIKYHHLSDQDREKLKELLRTLLNLNKA
jgi:hypothetical protein